MIHLRRWRASRRHETWDGKPRVRSILLEEIVLTLFSAFPLKFSSFINIWDFSVMFRAVTTEILSLRNTKVIPVKLLDVA